MMLLPPLCLLLGWMLPVDSMGVRLFLRQAEPPIPLNMMPDSVDDMYEGCREKMQKKVKSKYFKEENSGLFADVWKNALDCAEENLENIDRGDEALTEEHMQAICAYTYEDSSLKEQFYVTFNNHVREDRSEYLTSFHYHSMHFWLTSAVQILNNNTVCNTTYRRTNVTFTGRVNDIMRFGSFTSSSLNTTLTEFGDKTCFQITTCAGASLKHYSAVEGEAEVLIPPYEMFRITARGPGACVRGLEDCEVVFTLESSGVSSNLNCTAVM